MEANLLLFSVQIMMTWSSLLKFSVSNVFGDEDFYITAYLRRFYHCDSFFATALMLNAERLLTSTMFMVYYWTAEYGIFYGLCRPILD
jgi:hypothetical protein